MNSEEKISEGVSRVEETPQEPPPHAGTAPGEVDDPKIDTYEASDAAVKITGLQQQLEKLRSEAEEYKEDAARARADFYNYRTRIERDRARDRVLAAEGAVDALLPVLDNLERAIQALSDKESSLYKGVSMVYRQFVSAMSGLGLQEIDTTGAFDPSQHEAMMVVQVEGPDEDGKILEELGKGYKLGDKVLRAARVKVGRK